LREGKVWVVVDDHHDDYDYDDHYDDYVSTNHYDDYVSPSSAGAHSG
jgi:hypothetical protein